MHSRLQICVCGWYFYPSLYQTLRKLPVNYDPLVIAHRHGNTHGIRTVVRANVGLEFGAYAYFLQHWWDTRSNVLFLHDDVVLPIAFFQRVHTIPADQAYIFRHAAEYEQNLGHGRAIYATSRFLTYVQAKGGLWYDVANTGFVAQGPSWSEQPPPGCQDHNAGIRAFMALSKRIGDETGLIVNQPFYIPSAALGRRGHFVKDTPTQA